MITPVDLLILNLQKGRPVDSDAIALAAADLAVIRRNIQNLEAKLAFYHSVNDQFLEMLKDSEWAALERETRKPRGEFCWCCGRKPFRHNPDCELGILLKDNEHYPRQINRGPNGS